MSAYVVSQEHVTYLVAAAMCPSFFKRVQGDSLCWIWNLDHSNCTYERDNLHATEHDKATRVAQMLWDENIRSVTHRYPDCERGAKNGKGLPGPVVDDYIIDPILIRAWCARAVYADTFTAVKVLKACDGYEYQSCEHPEWRTSQACAFINALRRAVWQSLPGYDEAAWEVRALPNTESANV